VSFLRPLIVLFVIGAAVVYSGNHTPHHEGSGLFDTLYLHLMPAKLVDEVQHDAGGHETAEHEGAPSEEGHAEETHAEEGHGVEGGLGVADEELAELAGEEALVDGHGEHLLVIGLPGFLSFFDMDQAVEGNQLVLTNLQIFQIAAGILILVCFLGVPRYLRTGQGDYLTRIFAGFALWIRDEMVYPVMGKEGGRQFLPFFLTLFFFILFMNLLGLVPGSATATASIWVTGAMAAITLSTMVFGGMIAQGPIAYWKNLVPHVPLALWPLMFVVELVGVFVKPFALTIRLFANMTGGHLVVLSLMGMLFFFAAEMGQAVGWATSPVWVGFAVFIMIIEFFVAMLQAYIFTILSILFVQASLHPEH
jgi:F-type H+-transporting ATPase subunit a